MSSVQRDRSKGIKTPFKPKGCEPRGGDEHDPWPAFWDAEAEQCFRTLKKLAANAVRLSVPDLQGALDGTNKFLMFVVACGYGIGGGIFQRAVDKDVSRDFLGAPAGTAYDTLQVPADATQQQIARAVTARSRAAKTLDGGAREAALERVEAAAAKVQDVVGRKAYDEHFGLASTRRHLAVLTPLALWSRALTDTERRWTTWEQELKAVLELLRTFTGLLSGMCICIYTDHINNLTMTECMKQPAKGVRMLSEIESRASCEWASGQGQRRRRVLSQPDGARPDA